jgi:hypothetical protein
VAEIVNQRGPADVDVCGAAGYGKATG